MNSVSHRLDSQDYKYWLKSRSAKRLLALQSAWLQSQLGRFSGAHLMFHGLAQNTDFLRESPIRHAFRLGVPWQQGVVAADAWMTSSDWPLGDQSISLVVMQHSLDFTRRPHQMIREAARVLTPSGYLVIIGFNPWSWWGGVQKMMPLATEMPWLANSVSMSRLKDWLMLLDFSIQSTDTMGHVWPITMLPEDLSQRVDNILAGPSSMGNLYMIIAQKTMIGMTSIRSRRWSIVEPQLGWAKGMRNTQL